MAERPPVTELVEAALEGDEDAWTSLVERFGALVSAIARRHRLDPQELADVCQTVWLTLLEKLPTLREPRALAGWIRTTTRNESIRALRARRRQVPLDGRLPASEASVDSELLAAERRQLLREAFGQLSARCRELLAALMEDPPPSYAEISKRLGLPTGSIGPTRARCLEHLRRSPVLRGLVDEPAGEVSMGGAGRGATVDGR